jgi:hypothetical protein
MVPAKADLAMAPRYIGLVTDRKLAATADHYIAIVLPGVDVQDSVRPARPCARDVVAHDRCLRDPDFGACSAEQLRRL